MPQPYNPSAWDRYAYVNNNPINRVDPTGHYECEGGMEGCDVSTATTNKARSDYYNALRENPTPVISVLPVDAYGVQWFGPTQRAYDLKYVYHDEVYAYCGYWHCGLDLLADYGSPVHSGTYGQVIAINSSKYEGPYNISVRFGDYVIKYGHSDGTANVKVGDYVIPGTFLTGVGNMGGSESSGQIDHIHLEVRGPGGWSGGDSLNPVYMMNGGLVTDLQAVAMKQTVQIEMGKFPENLDNPSVLFPISIHRTTNGNYWK